MKLLHVNFDNFYAYIIIRSMHIVRINNSLFSLDCDDLIKKFKTGVIRFEAMNEYYLDIVENAEILGEFKSRDDIEETFAEYLI